MSDDKPKRPRPRKADERPTRRAKTTSEETRRDDATKKFQATRAPRAAERRDDRRPREDAPPRDERPRGQNFDKKRPVGARAAPDRKTRYKTEEPRPRTSTGGGEAPLKRKGPRKTAEPAAPREKAFEGERIAKVMARAGACSRRDAEQWIADGRVAVNGEVLTSPAYNVREGDHVAVDGAPLAERERTRLFLFHKPAGLVTSAKDPEGRETVFAYLQEKHEDLPRVVSVGRLDINTEGLLLLSNDGGLARTLELPATGWTRRYRVRVHGEVDQAQLDALAQGVTVEGVDYAPIEARLDRVQGANAWLTMSLSEGKNREIKRVLEHLGVAVTRLIRLSFGPFQLGDLAEGAVEEVRLKVLREQLGKSIAELAGVDFASPLRDEATPAETQEKRKAAQNRPRKHVSTLRKQRDERVETGPRARIERGMTADRKGRAVAVERVVVKTEKPTAETRNARRFAAARRDAETGGEERRFERPRKPAGNRDGQGAREGTRRPRFEGAPERGRERNVERGPRREDGAKRFEGPRKPRGEGGAGETRRFDRPRAAPGARDATPAGRDEARRPRPEGGRDRGTERQFERAPRGEGGAKRFEGARKPRGEGFASNERRSDRPRAAKGETGAAPGKRDDARRPRSESAPARGRERDAGRSFERGARPDGGKKFDGPRKPRGDGPPRGNPPKGGPRKPR